MDDFWNQIFKKLCNGQMCPHTFAHKQHSDCMNTVIFQLKHGCFSAKSFAITRKKVLSRNQSDYICRSVYKRHQL